MKLLDNQIEMEEEISDVSITIHNYTWLIVGYYLEL